MFNQCSTLLLLWQRFSWRYWRHNLGKSIVLLAIFALGIAAYLAISMANRSAVSSFSGFTDALAGQSNWTLLSPSGVLHDRALATLRQQLSHTPVHIIPVLESTATLPRQPNDPDYGRRTFQLVGLDLIQLQNLTDGANTIENIEGLTQITSIWDAPNAIFITDKLANSLQLKTGDTLKLLIQDVPVDTHILGLLATADSTIDTPENLIVLDLPVLQRLAGLEGQLSRIEFLAPAPLQTTSSIDTLGTQLQAIADSDEAWQLTPTEQHRESAHTMTLAFRLNLQILALIALLVAIYLIAQALDASVVRRRREIATLRSLGVSKKMLLQAWLLEVIVFGILGSAFGILLGWGMAQVFVQAVAKTMNALYSVSEAQPVALTLEDVVIGFAIGITASIFTGWLPANDAASTPPAQILRSKYNESTGLAVFDRPWWGGILIVLGIGCYHLPPLSLAGGARFPLAGFAAAFLWIIGGTIIAGALFRPIGRLMRYIYREGACWHLASARLLKPTSRHKLAVSGLFIAIAMAAGMNILISSFAKTMETWIQTRFKADLYVSSEAGQSASSLNRIPAATWQTLINLPAVAAADVLQTFPITLNNQATFLSGGNVALLTERNLLPWVERPQSADWYRPQRSVVPAIINETFAERFGVTSGVELDVPTPQGKRRIHVQGIYADYGNERGSILIDQPLLSTWFENNHVTNLSLFLKPGYAAQTVLEAIQADHPQLALRTHQALRESILSIFRQTFAITHAVKWIGIAVALIGLALSLVSLIWESQSQLQLQAQLGIYRREMMRTFAYEGLGITITAVIGGLLLSIPLGYLLIYVINKQSFGWTLQFQIPWFGLSLLAAAVILMGFTVALLTTRCVLRSQPLSKHP